MSREPAVGSVCELLGICTGITINAGRRHCHQHLNKQQPGNPQRRKGTENKRRDCGMTGCFGSSSPVRSEHTKTSRRQGVGRATLLGGEMHLPITYGGARALDRPQEPCRDTKGMAGVLPERRPFPCRTAHNVNRRVWEIDLSMPIPIELDCRLLGSTVVQRSSPVLKGRVTCHRGGGRW